MKTVRLLAHIWQHSHIHAILHATQFVPAFKAKSGSANLKAKANRVVFKRPIKANQGELQIITFAQVTYVRGRYKALSFKLVSYKSKECFATFR